VPAVVELGVRVPDGDVDIEDAGADRGQHLPELGLGPDCAECARACSDDCDRLVA
jgi:hypothetical protein